MIETLTDEVKAREGEERPSAEQWVAQQLEAFAKEATSASADSRLLPLDGRGPADLWWQIDDEEWEFSLADLLENGRATMIVEPMSSIGEISAAVSETAEGTGKIVARTGEGVDGEGAGASAENQLLASGAPCSGEAGVQVGEEGESLSPVEVPVEAEGTALEELQLLKGTARAWAYSRRKMTDAFARWCLLAEEGDDLLTFVSCVREESQVYPRPMKAASLENHPFCMTPQRVMEAYERARALEDCSDLAKTKASNGDVYFYSTAFLSPKRAERLAEYESVVRFEKP